LNGTNYYRLKVVDDNGTFTYSTVVKIKLNNKETSLSVYPNPAHDLVIVKIPRANNHSQLRIVDMTGKVIRTQTITAGNDQIKIDVKGIVPGMYKIAWNSDSLIQSKSLQIE